MKIDLSTPLKDPKGEPYTMVKPTGSSVYLRMKRLHGDGVSFEDALKQVEAECGGGDATRGKEMLREMDFGDALYNAIEVSSKYMNGSPQEKRSRGRLLTKLLAKTVVELKDDEISLLKSDISEPATYHGAMLVALEDLFDEAVARDVEERKRAKEEALTGAKLTAVEGAREIDVPRSVGQGPHSGKESA